MPDLTVFCLMYLSGTHLWKVCQTAIVAGMNTSKIIKREWEKISYKDTSHTVVLILKEVCIMHLKDKHRNEIQKSVTS